MADRLKHMVPLAAAFLLTGVVSFPLLAGPAPKVVVAVERSYYLTVDEYQGDSTKTACASGYHFASILELVAWKEMVYNTELGFTEDDRQGPPNDGLGWVRGYSGGQGNLNCFDWTSNEQSRNGAPVNGDIAEFDELPILTEPNASPWDFWGPSAWCSRWERVWCVSDSAY